MSKLNILFYIVAFAFVLSVVPYDVFDGYSCVNDLSNGQLYETLNCRRPFLFYLFAFFILKLFGSLSPNVIQVVYSFSVVFLIHISYRLLKEKSKTPFLAYFLFFFYLIVLELPSMSFLFSTIFFILAFEALLNEKNETLASMYMFLSLNFNFVTLLAIPVLVLQYFASNSKIRIEKNRLYFKFNAELFSEVAKFIGFFTLATILLAIFMPNYLKYTLLYANTFTDRNVLDSRFIATGEVQKTSFLQPIIDFFTYDDPDKVHYKFMFLMSIFLIIGGELFYAPFTAFFYLAFGMKDLIWYFASLPARILVINSMFAFLISGIQKSNFKKVILLIILLTFMTNISYINSKNRQTVDRFANLKTYNIANEFIRNFEFEGKVLTDDLLIEQKFFDSNGGFLNTVEDSEWCNILVHKYGSIMGYSSCDDARMGEYILPEAEKINRGEYDLIAISPALTDTYIYDALSLIENPESYCAVPVPSLHDSCDSCRHYMLFGFKNETQCADFENQMITYYTENIEAICKDYPKFVTEMNTIFSISGVVFNADCGQSQDI